MTSKKIKKWQTTSKKLKRPHFFVDKKNGRRPQKYNNNGRRRQAKLKKINLNWL
jgi:hypothetical protein